MAEFAPPLVLGLESSCDETAAALVDAAGRILAERVASQEREHARFGGVVPELAARAHLALLPRLVAACLEEAGLGPEAIGAVAATSGPGLIGGLIVGASFGKGLAVARGVPFLAINHLEAHALTPRLPGLVAGGAPFPYLLLLVSGGHTLLASVEGVGRYRRLGSTMDDAVGEAFDKVAKLLGLGWPGGPAVEKLARAGDPRRFALPRPMKGRANCDFSFSGLKTAVAHLVAGFPPGPLPARDAADIAASFQEAVAETLSDRVRQAARRFKEGLGGDAGATRGAGGSRAGTSATFGPGEAGANGSRAAAPATSGPGDAPGRAVDPGAFTGAAGGAPGVPDGTERHAPMPAVTAAGALGSDPGAFTGATGGGPGAPERAEGGAPMLAVAVGAGGDGPGVPERAEGGAPMLAVAAGAGGDGPGAPDGTGGHAPVLVVSGGVAANARLRAALAEAAAAEGFTLAAPPLRLCTDNAVMVAWAGQERLRLGLTADGLGHAPRPRWPLESLGEAEGA